MRPIPIRALALPVLVSAYLAARLIRLGALPMFADEGGYITWGLRALHAHSFGDWLVSVQDGKQPLYVWLLPPALAIWPDRLIAGRLVSVALGVANLLLLHHLGNRLYRPPAGLIAAVLYVAAPAALIYDRMALYESLVATVALLTLLVSLRWAERPIPSRTVMLGLAMGAALLTKTSALFFIVLVPVAAALWRPASLRRWWHLALAGAVAAVLCSPLLLSPQVSNLWQGNARYALSLSELLRAPAGLWLKNAHFAGIVATSYLGWPIVALALLGALLSLAPLAFLPFLTAHRSIPWWVPQRRADLVPVLWTAIPLLGLIATARLYYPRYAAFALVIALLPATGSLRILSDFAGSIIHAAVARELAPRQQRRSFPIASSCQPRLPSLAAASRRSCLTGRPTFTLSPAITTLLTLLLAIPGLLFDAHLLADPLSTPWVDARDFLSDRWQLIQGEESGYGLSQVIGMLRDAARTHPIAVLTMDETGIARDGVAAYLLHQPNVALGFTHMEPSPDGWTQEGESIQERVARLHDAVYDTAVTTGDVYYVLSAAPDGDKERRFAQLNPGLVPILEVLKPDGAARFRLYHLRWTDPTTSVTFDSPFDAGGIALLRGYTLSSRTTTPGGTLRLVLRWEARGGATADYTVFNHLVSNALTAAEKIVAQRDGVPVGAGRPTTTWRRGETLLDTYVLRVKPDTPPGRYDLLTGLYDPITGQRLTIRSPGHPDDTRAVLGQITIAD